MRGAQPRDLPVEQPTRYEVHLNLRTARMFDLNVPAAFVSRADQIIE